MVAENIALVQEIDGDNESWKVKVKIVRLWKQTYSNNPHVVSSIEMVLIDEQGTRIHATVKRNLIGQFDALLEEGGVRILSKFGVGENAGRFLLTMHPCKINFYRHTSVRLSNDWAGPEQSFHLLAFNDILNSNFDFKYSLDVIGEVINCEDTKVMSIKGTERIVKSLQLQNEEESDECQREKRKTINGEDYIEPLKLYLNRYREIEVRDFLLFLLIVSFRDGKMGESDGLGSLLDVYCYSIPRFCLC